MNFLNLFDTKFKIVKIEDKITSIFLNFVTNDSCNQSCGVISKTSFNLNNTFLENLFFLYLQEKIEKKLSKNIILKNIWYQIYDENSESEHPYHNHNDSELSGIFYLQLPKSLVTNFIVDKKVLLPKVKDSEIIIFKSNILQLLTKK